MGEANSRDPQLAGLINALLVECGDPARLLELYYWSREPDLLPLIRAIASLPAETQRKLEMFIRDAKLGAMLSDDPAGQIRIEENLSGRHRRRSSLRTKVTAGSA